MSRENAAHLIKKAVNLRKITVDNLNSLWHNINEQNNDRS